MRNEPRFPKSHTAPRDLLTARHATTVALRVAKRGVTIGSETRGLEPPGPVSARHGDDIAKNRHRSTYSAKADAINGAHDAQDWATIQVREWLLLLLRFAITSDPKDRSAALGLADEMDARGVQWRPS